MSSSDNSTPENSTPCAICLDEILPAAEVRLPCGHAYHGKCIVEAMRQSPLCPLCRQASPAEQQYKLQMQQWRENMRKRRRVMRDPQVAQLVILKHKVANQERAVRAELKSEILKNPDVHRRMKQLQDKQATLRHKKQWFESRIRKELLQNQVPTRCTRPKPPT